MKKILVIAEKPSVTKEIVNSIDPTAKYLNGGYYESEKYFFTNALGHLLQIKKPEELDGEYKSFDKSSLPIMVNKKIITNYKVNEKSKKQFDIIKKLLKREDIEYIVNACDPDREGEGIFGSIYDFLGSKIPFRRLILKDMTKEGIQGQFEALELGEKYKGLKQAAYARAISDYMVGMNGTTALTVKYGNGNLLSVGRVQTPTLKLIYDRCMENNSHIKKVDYGIKAKIIGTDIELELEKYRVEKKSEAEELLLKLPQKINLEMAKKEKNKQPPALPKLNDLQILANKEYNLSADQTLSILQGLYEKHKATTYPRTDCNYITDKTAAKLDGLLMKFNTWKEHQYVYSNKINKKNVGEVKAHEAITPTGVIPSNLNDLENKIYSKVVLIYLANYAEDYRYNDVNYSSIVGEKLKLKGIEKELINPGYLNIYKDTNHTYKNILKSGAYDVEYFVNEIESKPKPLYTEATLLKKLENIHSDEEGETKKILKEIQGLGTPATRGSIIKLLFDRGYVEAEKKNIKTTVKGNKLIELLMELDSNLLNVAYTAELENKLSNIVNDHNIFSSFLNEVQKVSVDIVYNVLNSKPKNIHFEKNTSDEKTGGKSDVNCPMCKAKLIITDKVVICSKKEEGCEFHLFKRIAGKSITEIQIIQLIEKGKTGKIKGFKSKTGKTFDAGLVLDKNNKVSFDFSKN